MLIVLDERRESREDFSRGLHSSHACPGVELSMVLTQTQYSYIFLYARKQWMPQVKNWFGRDLLFITCVQGNSQVLRACISVHLFVPKLSVLTQLLYTLSLSLLESAITDIS